MRFSFGISTKPQADVKIWHGLSDGVLALALLAIAGGAVASLPVAGAFTARYGSRPASRAAALLLCAVLPLLAGQGVALIRAVDPAEPSSAR